MGQQRQIARNQTENIETRLKIEKGSAADPRIPLIRPAWSRLLLSHTGLAGRLDCPSCEKEAVLTDCPRKSKI